MTDTTDPQADSVADVDTVARRAAQVIANMGADIRALTGQRDRYRSAWCSARERAQAYGEGILRVVKDREAYQEWLRQAEERVPAVPSATVDRAAILREAADALVAVAGQHPEARAVVIHWGDAAALLRTMAQEECDELEAQAHLDELADDLSRMADETQQPETEPCGAWGGCTLARGHNIGQADIPENHRPPAAEAQQADTAGEQQ